MRVKIVQMLLPEFSPGDEAEILSWGKNSSGILVLPCTVAI
jgi:hypothetical protein